jgi:glutamine amidotransferase-like uncharacterized protein
MLSSFLKRIQILSTIVFISPNFAAAANNEAAQSLSPPRIQLESYGPAPAFTGSKLPSSIPNTFNETPILLYTGPGTWDVGVEHLKAFLNENDLGFKSMSLNDFNNSGAELLNQSKLLIMPGGQSWTYLADLGDSGAKLIRHFVSQGGSYFGICAGAFYATSMRKGGYASGPYGIGLLEGTAYDGSALKTKPFINGMMDFDVFLQPFAGIMRIILFGGPSFRYSKSEAASKNIQVIANFQKINEAAMIQFEYHKGRVFLSGPHLEIEEDRTRWRYKDPDSEWPLMKFIFDDLLSD